MTNIKKKKYISIMVISFIIFIIVIFSFNNITKYNSNKVDTNEKEITKSVSNTGDVHKDLITKLKYTDKIEVYHDYHASDISNINPIEIKDKNIINDYLDLLSRDVKKSTEELSGGSVNNQKLVFYTDNEAVEVNYTYDDLYNFGFISYGGKDIYIDYDFFRLISNTEKYSPQVSNISDAVENLFNNYNWTPSFLISKNKVKISDDLMYAPEKGIDEVYWAYNLQLSKSINLDFSNLLGKEVDAEVYYLLESLPNFTYPIVDTRAVVLKYNDEIVGAYIDSGIVNRAICSLDRKSFDEITGYVLEDYLIENHIDENSKLNKEIAKLNTQEIIELYYKSQSDKDVSQYLSTLDMGAILSLLETDTVNIQSKLFNSIDKNADIFKIANKVEVLEVKDDNSLDGEKEVNIKVNILNSNDITIDKGIYDMIVLMRKNENGVYKVNSVGF